MIELTVFPQWMRYLSLIFMSLALVILLQFVSASTRIDPTSSNNGTNDERFYNSSSHTRRRIQHALTGILFYLTSFTLPQSIASLLLVTTTIAFYKMHTLRSSSKTVQEWYMKHFGALLREKEKSVHVLPGAFYFLLGNAIIFVLFPLNIARTSLLCLSFGDRKYPQVF